MRKAIHLLSIGLSVSVLAAISAASAQNPAPTQGLGGDAERGAALYLKVGCYQCHGYAGQGGGAPKLAPQPHPAFVIASYIRRPAGTMPPYAKSLLSDQDVADITAWLGTIPDSPAADDIDILPKSDSISARH